MAHSDPSVVAKYERAFLYDAEKQKCRALFGSGPKGPFPSFDPSVITIPTVPEDEKDPYARINVMIDIFNARLRPSASTKAAKKDDKDGHVDPSNSSSVSSGKIDRGLYHEIQTAICLVTTGGIYDGRQISRPLTKAEDGSGLKGHSQMITVPLEDGHFREIDMLCEVQGKPFVVEAKNKKTSDTSQLRPNVQLAQQLGGGVMYSLGGKKDSQDKALKDGYEELAEARTLPPLEVIHIHEPASDLLENNKIAAIPMHLITKKESSRRQDLEFDFGMKISYSDLASYEADLKLLDDDVYKGTKSIGWAARALGLEGWSRDVIAIAFSSDGTSLASASDDSTVRLWDLKTGTLQQTFECPSGGVIAAAFSPDGTSLASSSSNKVRLWDVKTGACWQTLEYQNGFIRALAFSPDGTTIVSASDAQHEIQLRDVKTGSLRQTFSLKMSSSIYAVAMSPDGTTLAWAFENTVQLHNLNTGTWQALNSPSVRAVVFSPDGTTIASASSRNDIRLWDRATGELRQEFQRKNEPIENVAFTRNGTAIAFSPESTTIASASDKKALLWDVTTGTHRLLTVSVQLHS